MMHLKKLLVSMMTTGLLVGAIAISNAVTIPFTVYVDNPDTPPPANDWSIPPGAATTSGSPTFHNLLLPTNGTNGVAYNTPSVIRFGADATDNPGAGSATFGMVPVGIAFDLQVGSHQNDPGPLTSGDPYHHFELQGHLNGDVTSNGGSNTSSTTNLIWASLTDATTGDVDNTPNSMDPVTGQPAFFLHEVIGGQPFDIFVQQIRPIPAPGKEALTVEGFVTTSVVPEPGAVACLLGTGVIGGFLARRRRRR